MQSQAGVALAVASEYLQLLHPSYMFMFTLRRVGKVQMSRLAARSDQFILDLIQSCLEDFRSVKM